jgi:hypothetical protein
VEAPRGSILKSVHGLPFPVYPRDVDLPKEARTARRRFMPVTILYTSYLLPMLVLGLRARFWASILTFAVGVAFWTWLEYTVHRFVLHGRFPDGPGRFQHLVHRFFDTMHGDHHLRPWDGMYINGFLDSLPFAIILVALSYLVPFSTAPLFVATLLQCYVIEEWVHYTVHFHRFRSRYFDYIRRHHLYHHCPRGTEPPVAFGLTNGIWDVLRGTRISAEDRQLLYGSRRLPESAASKPAVSP